MLTAYMKNTHTAHDYHLFITICQAICNIFVTIIKKLTISEVKYIIIIKKSFLYKIRSLIKPESFLTTKI